MVCCDFQDDCSKFGDNSARDNVCIGCVGPQVMRSEKNARSKGCNSWHELPPFIHVILRVTRRGIRRCLFLRRSLGVSAASCWWQLSSTLVFLGNFADPRSLTIRLFVGGALNAGGHSSTARQPPLRSRNALLGGSTVSPSTDAKALPMCWFLERSYDAWMGSMSCSASSLTLNTDVHRCSLQTCSPPSRTYS